MVFTGEVAVDNVSGIAYDDIRTLSAGNTVIAENGTYHVDGAGMG